MYSKLVLTAAVAMSFALPAFAATTPAPKLYFVESVGGICKVSDVMATAPTLTAPDRLEPNIAGYKSLAAAQADLAKLVKAKTCKTA